MKTLWRTLLGLAALLVLVGIIAYADGASLPVNHVVSVNGMVSAPPTKVFELITGVAAAPTWRHEVKSVNLLPPIEGREHWVEDLGHGVQMNFIATRTDPVSAEGTARRDVLLNDASYGGTWTYELTPGPTADQTNLKITETGYINPPIYRFMMAHIFGMTKNLDQYMTEIKAAAKP